MTSIKRGEKIAIPFSITDAANGLATVRVTCALAAILKVVNGVPATRYATPPVLKKATAAPPGGSSAEITITGQAAGLITGTINILAADYANLPDSSYALSLWIDDGSNNDRCVTANGAEILTILESVPRT